MECSAQSRLTLKVFLGLVGRCLSSKTVVLCLPPQFPHLSASPHHPAGKVVVYEAFVWRRTPSSVYSITRYPSLAQGNALNIAFLLCPRASLALVLRSVFWYIYPGTISETENVTCVLLKTMLCLRPKAFSACCEDDKSHS